MLVNRYLKLLSPMGTQQQNHAFVVSVSSRGAPLPRGNPAIRPEPAHVADARSWTTMGTRRQKGEGT